MIAKPIIVLVLRHRDQIIVRVHRKNDQTIEDRNQSDQTTVMTEHKTLSGEMRRQMRITGVSFVMETEHQLVSSESNLL